MASTSNNQDPKHDYIKCIGPGGFHKVAYTEWGDPDNPEVLFCVHGITRNARDFDHLARVLQNEYRIVCPDVVGRGRSDLTGNPLNYNYVQYINDMTAMVARSGAKEITWLGTSMGGIIGMMIAAQPRNPIKKLILNDVGMFIPKSALERIVKYASIFPTFSNLEEAKTDLENRLSTFGIKNPEHFNHLLKYAFKEDATGNLNYHYDPTILKAFAANPIEDVHMEPVWSAITCPVLIIRGAESDILQAETLKKMVEMKPGTQTALIPHTGHAPTLMEAEQIKIVSDWLNQTH
jgi:pimeloyl-ACP methyl ester carboxylesterase